MNEKLLQFIWQFQYFNKQALFTTEGESLVIEKQGMRNQHQGPDFLEAVIRLGTTTWAGNIELHVKASDWHTQPYRPGFAGVDRINKPLLHTQALPQLRGRQQNTERLNLFTN